MSSHDIRLTARSALQSSKERFIRKTLEPSLERLKVPFEEFPKRTDQKTKSNNSGMAPSTNTQPVM